MRCGLAGTGQHTSVQMSHTLAATSIQSLSDLGYTSHNYTRPWTNYHERAGTNVVHLTKVSTPTRAFLKWGGLEQIGTFLRDARNRRLLDKFLDISDSADGEGVYLSDRRRYLDLAAAKKIVGDVATSLLDELVAKQVIHRGFVFGCSYCRNVAWFAVGEINQEFTCRRCTRRQVYTKHHWRQPDEPSWFYKLDELIYLGYRQGMAVPILALDYLKGKSKENFAFATEREFWKPGGSRPEMEVDFFCVSDGVLTIGEAKATNALGGTVSEERATINKYMHVVKALSIRQLVFATNKVAWRGETVDLIRTAFRELSQVAVVFLDGSDLLQ